MEKWVKGDVSICDSFNKTSRREWGSHRPHGTTVGLNQGPTNYI
jgi:hypothetical protein